MSTGIELHPCRPPLWASNGHAQTVLGHFWPFLPLDQTGQSFEVPLEDGDRLVCTTHRGRVPIVVYLFHGLGGDTGSDYMHRTARICRDLGYSVVLTNHRGCGAGEGMARAPYHSGRAEDLSRVIEEGRARFPGHTHLAIGFSLSGNALLLLLSGARGKVKPDAGISVNAPIHLERSSRLLHRGLNRIYDLRFVRRCQESLRSRKKHGLESREYRVPLLATLYDFDEIYTAPAGGFKNREDYYASCSAKPRLKNIDVPTLMMTSKDDPFIDYRDYETAELSPTTSLHIEASGGHMGYLTRDVGQIGTRRWLDYALGKAIPAMLARVPARNSL